MPHLFEKNRTFMRTVVCQANDFFSVSHVADVYRTKTSTSINNHFLWHFKNS